MTAYGQGEHRYSAPAAPANFGVLPEGWRFGEVAAVGVDRRDNVFVFTRGEHPIIVFDCDGRFLRAWGEGQFTRPHGVHVGPDDTLYLTDDGDHTVRRYTPEGRLLVKIGLSGKPAPFMSGEPFHRCTHTALSPSGDLYVADGYGNARVHKYSPDGRLLFSWGESGTGPGAFNIVHNICCDADGWVYVADRENHRIQVFDGNGRFETAWHDLYRPCGLCMRGNHFYVGELGPGQEFSNRNWPNLGPRVSILDRTGARLARFGDFGGPGRPSRFIAPHGMAVDSTGAIYVGELSRGLSTRAGKELDPSADLVCLQKFSRI